MDGKAVAEQVSVADAQGHLDELVDRVQRGETVELTRGGTPVARIVGVPRVPVDVEALQALTRSMPMQEESSEDFIRRFRNDARY